jgi:hypothetical protein
MDQTPWAWLHKNIDGMAITLMATMLAALISTFLRGVSATSLLLWRRRKPSRSRSRRRWRSAWPLLKPMYPI